jgi:putative hydrolase of the HAD superfamily
VTVRAVLLDAFGTLLRMEPPAPVLTALLADAGFPMHEQQVADALALEIRHYRLRMQLGRDAQGLSVLRAECAGVLVDALGPGAPPIPLATDLLVESLRFHLFDDVLPTLERLDDMGLVLGVVSNWDCALPQHLTRLGVADRFGVIVASAAVGYQKPDPAIFTTALSTLGVAPAEALHVGDRRVEDLDGARSAGLQALLLDRSPQAEATDDVITTLAQIPVRIAA